MYIMVTPLYMYMWHYVTAYSADFILARLTRQLMRTVEDLGHLTQLQKVPNATDGKMEAECNLTLCG